MDHIDFLWASVLQNQKFRDIFLKTLLFSKNLSNLDKPQNPNLIYLMKIVPIIIGIGVNFV